MLLNLTHQNTAQIFAHALLGVEGGQGSQNSTPQAIRSGATPVEPSCPIISHLIQRRDLLDDNNAGKEKMTEAKKKLKSLLRNGETERRADLLWPKSFKKEPVEVVKEVIAQLTELRAIMRANYENGNVERIPQQRWCSGDSPWLFRERWEKIFDDWVGVKQEKFDPSRVSELYDSVSFVVVVVLTLRSNTTLYTTATSSLPYSIPKEKVLRRELVPSTRIDDFMNCTRVPRLSSTLSLLRSMDTAPRRRRRLAFSLPSHFSARSGATSPRP